jgi:hypothetical protein
MNKATWAMLNENEKALLRATEPAELRKLDEDALIELHARVRRARNKYATLYRRRASTTVVRDSSRAEAHTQHARTATKAEVFEDVLARVSTALARAARRSAAELRAERLAAARRTPRPSTPRASQRRDATAPRSHRVAQSRSGTAPRRSPISERTRASNRAATSRAAAKQASR